MPVQNSNPSTAFRDVLTAVTGRLRAYFTKRGFVKVTVNPESRLPEYKAQDGLLVYVSSPVPKPKDGAGRLGRRLVRDVVVFVLTQSLHDAPGDDEVAVLRHVAREEEVANVLDMLPPASQAYANRVGIWIEWVAGGDDILRRVKIDQGMLVSALRFRVEYNAPMKVTRD